MPPPVPTYDAKPQLLSTWIPDNHACYTCCNNEFNLNDSIQRLQSEISDAETHAEFRITYLLFTPSLGRKSHFCYRPGHKRTSHITFIIYFFIFFQKYTRLISWHLDFNLLFQHLFPIPLPSFTSKYLLHSRI